MPGYLVTAVEGTPKSGLLCVHCKFFLREPVQTEEGFRLCKSCFSEIQSLPDGTCTECEVSTGSEGMYYPDKAVRREVLSILVFCQYHHLGCEWKGLLMNWESHTGSCEFKGVPCNYDGCKEILSRKDLANHQMVCPFRPTSCRYCEETFPYNKIQSHDSVCEEALITCDESDCRQQFPRKKISEHKLYYCSVQTCLTCNVKVQRSSGREIEIPPAHLRGIHNPPSSKSSTKELQPLYSDPVMGSTLLSRDITTPPLHLSDPFQNFQHHQILSEDVKKLEEDLTTTNSKQRSFSEELETANSTINHLKDENNDLKANMSDLRVEISNMTKEINIIRRKIAEEAKKSTADHTLLGTVEELRKTDAEKTSAINRLKRELGELQRLTETIKNQSENSLMGGMFGNTGILEKDSVQRRGHTSLGVGSASEARAIISERRVEELSRQMTMVKVHVQELELQLQASLASTHNGTFLWRIPDVSRRRRDAIEERVTSIYSPPFYTGRNGYKMCVRAYLNGDGMGYKTHLSLFFVLMRGECDPLLKWPFEHKVSMILVDQTHRKHIVQTFKPTSESSSFQQPITDMNVASGCPQFTKLSIFEDESYVKNDVMFIKCIVDATKIFHP